MAALELGRVMVRQRIGMKFGGIRSASMKSQEYGLHSTPLQAFGLFHFLDATIELHQARVPEGSDHRAAQWCTRWVTVLIAMRETTLLWKQATSKLDCQSGHDPCLAPINACGQHLTVAAPRQF